MLSDFLGLWSRMIYSLLTTGQQFNTDTYLTKTYQTNQEINNQQMPKSPEVTIRCLEILFLALQLSISNVGPDTGYYD
jgi:hypothetical protein